MPATVPGVVSAITAGLAWAFFATRIVHTFIHAGPNDVRLRFPVFTAGVGCLAMIGGLIAGRVLGAS